MAQRKSLKKSPKTLRHRAETLLPKVSDDVQSLSPIAMQALIHDLRVHQIELEIQNEELLQTQVELADSRDRYAELYEFAPIGYVSLDRSGKILEANLTAATLLGVERYSLVQSSFSKFVSHDSQDTFYHYCREVFAEESGNTKQSNQGSQDEISHDPNLQTASRLGTKRTCDLHLKRLDGVPLIVRLESTADGPAHKRLCRTALIDVTARNLAEDALRRLNIDIRSSLQDRTSDLYRSVEQVRLLSDATAQLGEGVLITNNHALWPGSKIVFVNDALCRITGYAAEELIDHSPNVPFAGCRDENLEQVRAELSAGRSCLMEFVNQRKDGSSFDAEIHATPLRETDGQPSAFITIYRDVTERKRTTEALRESEQQLRAILDTAAESIVTINQAGVMLSVNPATERMFGYSRKELIGNDLKLLMPQPFCDEHDEYIARYFATDEARILGIGQEVVGKRRDGSTFPIELSISVVDHLGLFTGIIRDISIQQKLQQQLLTISSDEQQRIGQDLHDSVGQHVLAAGLTVRTLAELLKEQDGSEQLVNLAGKLQSGLRTLLKEVRDLSKGLIPVEVEPEGLMLALDQLANDMTAVHHVDCTFHCDQPVRIASSEKATHLYRIAQEAVSNAIKHAQSHEIRICLESNRDTVSLTVDDDGRGVPEVTDRQDGIGIRTMRYRTSLMGGRLKIEAASKGGTHVSCLVPRGSLP